MRKLRRFRWLLLVLVVVPALITLMGCEDIDVDDDFDEPPPVNSVP